jgi:hypothetical protein
LMHLHSAEKANLNLPDFPKNIQMVSKRLQITLRALAATTICFSAACSYVQPSKEEANRLLQGKTIADADALLKRSKHLSNTGEVAAVYQIRAAEIAWNMLDTDGGNVKDISDLSESKKHAIRVLRKATEELSSNFVGLKYQAVKQFSHAGFSYQINAATLPKIGVTSLGNLTAAKPASEVRHRLCKQWHTEDGVGAPLASKWKRPTEAKISRVVSSRGYMSSLTAVLSFNGAKKSGAIRSASLIGYDPTYISKIQLGKTEYPLAGDFTATMVDQTSDIHEFRLALKGLIHPGEIDAKLISLEPYDPNRIPVLFVHGLNSHPLMWRDIINDLRADPKLRGRYQFMIFYYPTAWPISYSSMRLRQELAAWEAAVGTPKKMVLVGHSMGGLLSRMQVINPERKIWNETFGKNSEALYTKLPKNHLSKQMLLFSPNPDIGRVVYICTPQRGSRLADLSITSWFIKILKLPSTITGTLIDIPGNIIQQGKLNSVAELSPTNPLFKALDQSSIQVPHHSIIGDRGKGDTPNSSDGVVAYWSSHLNSARSEKIVPAGHGAFDHPQAINELRRILLLNAGIKE